MQNSVAEFPLKLIELDEYEEKLLPKVSQEIAAAINQTGFISV